MWWQFSFYPYFGCWLKNKNRLITCWYDPWRIWTYGEMLMGQERFKITPQWVLIIIFPSRSGHPHTEGNDLMRLHTEIVITDGAEKLFRIIIVKVCSISQKLTRSTFKLTTKYRMNIWYTTCLQLWMEAAHIKLPEPRKLNGAKCNPDLCYSESSKSTLSIKFIIKSIRPVGMSSIHSYSRVDETSKFVGQAQQLELSTTTIVEFFLHCRPQINLQRIKTGGKWRANRIGFWVSEGRL